MKLARIAESGAIADFVVRMGIRRLLARRLATITSSMKQPSTMLSEFADQIRRGPLAIATDRANDQHYELPPAFFECILGEQLKYSCCLFDGPQVDLSEAEDRMLAATCERAQIQDGMNILELGCGWGSLSLAMARRYPRSRITCVSNSSSQRRFIQYRAGEMGLKNLQAITADMQDFDSAESFDRIVSVEMFEHMRNYELLFQRLAKWLSPDERVFVHIFCHRSTPYLFDTEGADDWMGRNFFTGGMMPSEDLFRQFDEDLQIERQWRVSGMHYFHTCEHWLRNFDRNRKVVLSMLRETMTAKEAQVFVQRWRIFFLACAELFRYHNGKEWFVAHYLMRHASAEVQSRRSTLNMETQCR